MDKYFIRIRGIPPRIISSYELGQNYFDNRKSSSGSGSGRGRGFRLLKSIEEVDILPTPAFGRSIAGLWKGMAAYLDKRKKEKKVNVGPTECLYRSMTTQSMRDEQILRQNSRDSSISSSELAENYSDDRKSSSEEGDSVY
ncbi:hypothetical protein CDAR_471851 [Caerostris darwini]|uniref:Uncharacterized protein n=1 Tax=Caerostris darwini TaxID=1538125 RepID=A0AAV4RVM5_9ARAC|nr:hypothetical protein CDAR_471851 [Caerostris darwini]